MTNVKFYLAVSIVLWLFGFLYVINNSLSSGSGTGRESRKSKSGSGGGKRSGRGGEDAMYDLDAETGSGEWSGRLRDAMKQLEALEARNQKNERLIESLQENLEGLMQSRRTGGVSAEKQTGSTGATPSTEAEKLRRKIFSDISDISYFFKSQMSSIRTSDERVDKFKEDFDARINVLLAEFSALSNADGLETWRQETAQQLADKVRAKIARLQNPTDCRKAKKVVCDLNKACGFGCQMHHVLYCFITAFFTERTLVLESAHWRYNPRGFEAYFQPVSETCVKSETKAITWGESGYEAAQAIKMPIVDVLTHRPQFMPLAVPKELVVSLERVHGAPFVWWAGQLLSYLMRFNADFEKTVDGIKSRLGFKTPCVGVHVRRTDKVGTEAAYHSVDEYMRGVDSYFRLQDEMVASGGRFSTKKRRSAATANATRNVYLASDDVKVLTEARKNYPQYNFIFDETFALSASVSNRYSPESALGVILDIYFLSQCDYLVCTFSSQVCRMAYELMQARYPDASWRFTSLDDVYYYGGQTSHNVKAVFDHVPDLSNGEIELKIGDLIGLAGNHWNGFSKGLNRRTNQEGLFPSYKVVETVESF